MLLITAHLVTIDPIDFTCIKLPSKIRKRGRPKGGNSTVIGLPKKKKHYDGPVNFFRSPTKKCKGKYLIGCCHMTWLKKLYMVKQSIAW